MTNNESTQEETESDREDTVNEHLESIPDGSGCTEIWEHLSQQRTDGEDEQE